MKILFNKRKILIIVIMAIIITFSFFKVIDNYFGGRVETYARQKATQNASDMISQVINEEVLSYLDVSSLIIDNESGIIVNTIYVNNVLKKTNNILSDCLNDETLLSTVKIPYGILFSELLFSNSDVGLSVNIRPVGTYEADVVTAVEEYGINNSLFKVSILVSISIEILIPYNVKTINVQTELPLVMQIVQGEVPPGIWYGTN